MMRPRPFGLVLAFALSILGTGCAGIFGSRSPEESAVITVSNDLAPADDRTIQIRKDGADPKTLGTVPAGTDRALPFASRELQGAYQLIARQSSGAALVSREFTLFVGARVRWDMQANSVTVTQ